MKGDYFSLIAILSLTSVTMLYFGSQSDTTYVYDTASNLQKRFRTKLEQSMPACCKALTKECLSCAAGMLVKDFCDRHKGEYGCPNVTVTPPPDQNICCQDDRPLCKACQQGITLDEYIEKITPKPKFPPISPTERNQLDRWYRQMQRIGVPIPKLNQYDSILDIGANVGVFSKTARRICPKCHIYAFEAVPLFASYIKTKNFGNIDIYPFGLSDENGNATFWMSNDGNFGWNTMIGKDRKNMKKVVSEFKIFDDLHIDIPKLQLIKIDTEGAEYKVLRGLNNVIRKHRPTLLVEFGFGKSHPNYEYEIAEFDKLIAMGYKCDIDYRNVQSTTDLRFIIPHVDTTSVSKNLKIMLAIPTYNRIGYTEFHAKVIREYHKIPSSQLFIFDDCSTEYGEKELREWYGKDIHFFPCKKRLRSDANIRRMFEYFITTDFDIIFSVDTDLIFQKNWMDFIDKHIGSTDGVMSLYHSNAPHHRTFNCGNDLCEKNSMGSAGTVMKKDTVKKMLGLHKTNLFDWGFVSIFKKLKIRMLVPKNSLIMHYGQIGQNNGCGTKEVAKGFDKDRMPLWIKEGLNFYFDKCNKPNKQLKTTSANSNKKLKAVPLHSIRRITRNKLKPPNSGMYFKDWKPNTYKRCAIVASGPSLKQRRLGKHIDDHDAVFRINSAPTRGFEEDVGSFTTFRVSYGAWCVSAALGMSHGICTVDHSGEQHVKALFNSMKSDIKVHERRYPMVWGNLLYNNTKIKSSNDLHMYYHNSYKAASYYNLHVDNPTSGFNAIIASLDFCTEYIDLYGFDMGQDLTLNKIPNKAHYYDYYPSRYPTKKEGQGHNMKSEWERIQQISI